MRTNFLCYLLAIKPRQLVFFYKKSFSGLSKIIKKNYDNKFVRENKKKIKCTSVSHSIVNFT